jgi:hypothetical protein
MQNSVFFLKNSIINKKKYIAIYKKIILFTKKHKNKKLIDDIISEIKKYGLYFFKIIKHSATHVNDITNIII